MVTDKTFEEVLLATARLIKERDDAQIATQKSEREATKFANSWVEEQKITSDLRAKIETLSERIEFWMEAHKDLDSKLASTKSDLASARLELQSLEKELVGHLPNSPDCANKDPETKCADCKKSISGPVWGTVVCSDCVVKGGAQ
jgi:chromosome segregation ATPase